MSVHNQEIAERLKTIRELSDMTPAELAAEINVPEADYLACENGEAEIPISLLYDVSNTLGVSITELITGEQAKLRKFSYVRKGKGVRVERSDAYKYEDLAYNFVGRKVSPFLVTVAPSDEREPYHLNVHTGHEYHYCLSGSFNVNIAGQIITMSEGDSLYFDSANPHGMKALNGVPAQVLVVVI